jgi:Uma2 family endonuclease
MSATARARAVPGHVPTRMTVAEFLDWPGDGHPYLHQLIDGEPIAMAPPSEAHAAIQANLTGVLFGHLRMHRPGCRVVTNAGVVPRVRSRFNMRVPDLAVTCAPADRRRDALEDPILLVEILSPSNEAETREAVWSYTTVPSVAELLIVHSVEVAAELWRRESGGSWPADPTRLGAADRLELGSAGLEVPLRDLYAGTVLAPD